MIGDRVIETLSPMCKYIFKAQGNEHHRNDVYGYTSAPGDEETWCAFKKVKGVTYDP